MEQRITFFGILIWTLAILFFFYEFFLRIVLGTIASEVIDNLQLTVEQFSMISAAYYITYGLMQVPVGILTEKIGVRIILSFAAGMCALGAFWLSFTHSFYPAFFSRLLIGFGSSFAFVSLLVLALNWFPRKYFAFLCGISLFLGAVGPMLAGAPLAHLYERLGGNWRLILFWVSLFGVVLAVLLALFIRTKPKQTEQRIIFITPHEPLSSKLIQLLKNRQAWFVLLCTASLYVTLPLLAAYWGTTYLQTRGFGKTKAAFIISMVWVGYAIGSPLIGKLSDWMKRRKPFLIFFSLIGITATTMALYFPIKETYMLVALFFLIGFAASAQGLAYAIIVEHTPQKLHSTALGLNNGGVMLLAAIIPSIVSSVIQSHLHASGRITLLSQDFLGGLSAMPIAFTCAALIALFAIKETYCREQQTIHKISPTHKASDLF